MVVLRSKGTGANLALFAPLARRRSISCPQRMFEQTSARQAALRRALTRLSSPSVHLVSLAYLSPEEVDALRQLSSKQDFRQAQSKINYKGRSVSQDFDVCFPAPRIDAFDQLAHLLEDGMRNVTSPALQPPPSFTLNDFAIQNYPAGSKGIGIHRDGARYHHIVVIINLAGGSRLFTCDDRNGHNKRRVNDQPGRIVLLSATGFCGADDESVRPLHGVDRVGRGRLSIGLRFQP
jgi:hypothetical protein